MVILKDGYELIDGFLTEDQLFSINKNIHSIALPNKLGGTRNAEKKFSSIGKLAASPYLLSAARNYLAGNPSLVRAILFDKTPESNWLVAWHQDKTVAVSSMFENPDWGPWSVKDGVHHVQVPLAVLNQMVTFRIHLDDTNKENGCLKLISGSHTSGILSQEEIHRYTKLRSPVFCEAKSGSALVMRPHILHASSKAIQPSQRRVLHLEYSSYELPSGIAWA